MKQILLYYKYIDVDYPLRYCKWQKDLCVRLGLKGRIIIATEGINGTVAGTIQACNDYKDAMNNHPIFYGIDFKLSSCHGEPFPRLRVVEKKEITHLGKDTQKVSYKQAGRHVSPHEAHTLIEQNKNLIILDARNSYESAIGSFINAITPAIETFREFPDYIDAHADLFKDKDVLMYCTGGIRCERASAYLNSKGIAQNVYQITGGIDRYTQAFPNGYFKGKNYVFDGRIAVKVTDDILGSCSLCTLPADDYYNCIYAVCNKQIVICATCIQQHQATCSAACKHAIAVNPSMMRTTPHKTATCIR